MSAPWVLYVDDEPANLVVFEAAVGRHLPVLTATGGEEALTLLAAHEVGVLLTDQRMPGMSGVDLMVRAKQLYPGVIRLLITAYSDLEAAIDAINRGEVHLYLRKPWEPVELLQILTQARERYTLARRIGELERRLVDTERAYALGVAAAGLAHELRNPLTALQLGLEGIGAALAPGKPVPTTQLPVMSRLLIDAKEAVRTIVDITRSIELSTRNAEVGEVDLKEVAELAARSVKGAMVGVATFHAELEPVPVVVASRTKLGQVVLNLLVNAVEALDPARRVDNRVTLSLRARAGHVEVEVADNGPGIPGDALAHIFDAFFTTKGRGGTGLGLAISRRIVEEVGGSISVDSRPGEGTRFLVRIPHRR